MEDKKRIHVNKASTFPCINYLPIHLSRSIVVTPLELNILVEHVTYYHCSDRICLVTYMVVKFNSPSPLCFSIIATPGIFPTRHRRCRTKLRNFKRTG